LIFKKKLIKPMAATKIHIFKGPVHSGKTFRLLNWAGSLQSIDGIAAPFINSNRYLQHISSRKKKLLQLPVNTHNLSTEKVGPYIFSKEVFAWGRKILLDCMNNETDWLVIDEIGLLELDGRGLEPAVSEILNCSDCSIKNIVLVVRDNLVSRVIKHYGFSKREMFYFDPENSRNI